MAASEIDIKSSALQHIREQLQNNQDDIDEYLRTLKLANMGNMVGGVTHTLNNILGGILGYAQLLKEIVDKTSEAYQNTDVIEKAAKRASQVISQLQFISDKDSEKLKPVDPKIVVREVLTIVKSMFNKHIHVSSQFNHESALVNAYPSALTHVLLSICLNSKHYMKNGGELCIETDIEQDFIIFKISDTVKKRERKSIPYLFEPFYTNGSPDDPGLGLAISNEIVQRHNGKITVETKKNGGTTFYVYIPKAAQKGREVEHEDKAPEATKKVNSQATIMVVDDEEELRDIAKQIFERKGFDVLTAQDGDEALKLFRKKKTDIRLVILDMILPGEDGTDVYHKLKKVSSDAKFILTSGYVNNSPFKEIVESDATEFVPKPWDLPDLVQKAKTIL